MSSSLPFTIVKCALITTWLFVSSHAGASKNNEPSKVRGSVIKAIELYNHRITIHSKYADKNPIGRIELDTDWLFHGTSYCELQNTLVRTPAWFVEQDHIELAISATLRKRNITKFCLFRFQVKRPLKLIRFDTIDALFELMKDIKQHFSDSLEVGPNKTKGNFSALTGFQKLSAGTDDTTGAAPVLCYLIRDQGLGFDGYLNSHDAVLGRPEIVLCNTSKLALLKRYPIVKEEYYHRSDGTVVFKVRVFGDSFVYDGRTWIPGKSALNKAFRRLNQATTQDSSLDGSYEGLGNSTHGQKGHK